MVDPNPDPTPPRGLETEAEPAGEPRRFHVPRIFTDESEQVEEDVRDELRDYSPEGEPPARWVRWASTGLLVLVATVVFVTVVLIVARLGGWVAAVLAAAFVLVAYLLAGFPILQAARLRLQEEVTVRRVIKGDDSKRPPVI